MIDKTIPHVAVLLVKNDPADYPRYSLPEGYSFESFQPGREDDWVRIHLDSELIDGEEAARNTLEKEFKVDPEGMTKRMWFVIDPEGIIRSIIYYPLTTGRNFDEIKRMIQALQKSDEAHCSTPANWRPGDDCIISAPVTCEAAAAGMASESDDEYALDWFLRFKKEK